MNRANNVKTSLLSTASSVALLGYVCTTSNIALASGNDDRPLIWIELGGQAERAPNPFEVFSPPFFDKVSSSDLKVLAHGQELPPYSTGFEGKLSFQPRETDWIFSAAIRYGRSGATRHLHHQTAGFPSFQVTLFGQDHTAIPFRTVYSDNHSRVRESHAIVDFQVEKDVGLGLFGERGSSAVGAGVRIAQFGVTSSATFYAQPTVALGPTVNKPGKYTFPEYTKHAQYSGSVHSSRHVHGLGPSLSWDASVPIAGNDSDMAIHLDWGLNAAVLFARQKARVEHQTHGYYYYVKGVFVRQKTIHQYTNAPHYRTSSRSVTIPNAGGFAGLSLRFPNAKVSVGYRADFFFGALDGGIDVRKSERVGFYGPFASISVGLGD